MMKKEKFFLVILLISISGLVYSQQSLKGLVVNNEGESIPYAVISEILVFDESLVNFILCDSIGQFKINTSPKESYLYIKYLGYKSQKIYFKKDETNIKIVLETDTDADTDILLKEVEVVARKPVVKIMSDRLIYDLSSSPLKSDNTLEALKFVSLLNSNSDGFSIIGKENTIVYINGRKTNLNQESLMSYLRTLPANEVKNVEIITTPNSTFRGEGNFGVVNILLKSSESDGLKGAFSGQIWKTHYVKERGSLNLNYKKERLATNLNIGIANTSDWKKNIVETAYKQDKLNTLTNTLTDGDNLSYYAYLSFDYSLSKAQNIGLIINTSANNGSWTESGSTRFRDSGSIQTDSILGIHYRSKAYNPQIAINANYRLSFDNSRQYLLVDLDYLNNYNKQKSRNRINRLDEEENIFSEYQDFEQISPQRINLWSGKIEYGNNFTSDLHLKLGADMYYSNTKNDDKYKDWESGVPVIDELKSNNLEIKEWTPALFIHLNKEWSEKITSSIGSRFEYTKYKGVQHALNECFKNDYFKFLPTLYFAYKPSVNHKINYNLSYRISRPSFSSLNPFVTYTSPTSYSKGNPFLKPAKQTSHNLQYLFLNRYYFITSYNETNDIINGIEVIKENNLVERKPVNIGKQKKIRFLFNTNLKYLNENATLSLNLSYNWIQAKGNTESIDLNYISKYFNLYLNNYYQISKKHELSFDFGINYATKQKISNIISPAYLDINAQLRKQLKKWQISLYCNIGTYLYESKWTQKWKLIYETDELRKATYKSGEATSFGLRISYSFGNTKVKGLRERKTSNSDIKSRIN